MTKGTRVLITAGGSGIGKAIARAFAEAGAWIWVADLDGEALEACPKGWRRTRLDAADPAAVAAMFAEIEEDWGGLDVLCANAGTAGPTAAIEDISPEAWRACLSVNLDAAFLGAKYAAPLMKRQGWGSILLTSSTAGLHGYPNRSPYAAAKWALIGLAKTLAMELGPHSVRVNALCPGAVDGPRMDRVIAAEAAQKGVPEGQIRSGYAAGTALRTFVEARDIAEMALFLASPEARFVTGQAVSVDGFVFNPDP
ncbi:MAG: SDR family oxidoreductase [Pseudomonadota bacterium]